MRRHQVYTQCSRRVAASHPQCLLGATGVSDPFADLGTDQVEREWRLLIAQIASSDQHVRELQRFYSPWDKTWDPSLAEAREALIGELSSWTDYVFREECAEHEFYNGLRDRGRPAGTRLKDFIEHANAVQAELSPAHVAALRIYTTHLFKYLNGPLRDKSYGFCKKPQCVHPLRSNQ